MSFLQIRFIKGMSSANLACTLELMYKLHTHMWSDVWNVSYIELQSLNQVSYDIRSYECKLNNCV